MSQVVSIRSADLALANKFVRRLATVVGERIIEVTLYGSRAREDADGESDLDLFVAVNGDDTEKSVEKAAFAIACDLTLESGILVSAFVADTAFLRRHQGFALLEAIEEEGIQL